MLKQRLGTMEEDQDKSDKGDRSDPPNPMRRISSGELMQGKKEIIIVHEDSEYRLRITSQNKLILTK